jgi:hypothetical protein
VALLAGREALAATVSKLGDTRRGQIELPLGEEPVPAAFVS